MKKYLAVGVCIILTVSLLVSGDTKKQEEKPWEWSLEKVKSMVDKVRAGKDLTPSSWPEGAKVAVGLSFDFDAETKETTKQSLNHSTSKVTRASHLAL